jgi:type IV fimbrial biogenesis protein FimT
MAARFLGALRFSSRPAWTHPEPGYTLLQLVIVMLIVAILAAIGLPTFKYVTSSNRIATEANALLADMQYARSEAVKEGQPVTICAANVTATGAYTGCSSSNSWAGGWIVFADLNADHTYDTGDIVLRVQPAFTGTDTFVGGGNLSAATFNREGFASGYAGAAVVTLPVDIALHSTPANTAWTHCLVISLAGMPTGEVYGAGSSAAGIPTCA